MSAEVDRMTEERKQYLYNYQREKLKRIPLNVKKAEYELIYAAAKASGQSVNGYIKQAIKEKMEKEN